MLKVMVCVTGQRTCETLIRTGAQLVKEHGGVLSVVHVAKTGLNFLGNPQEGEALEYLFTISKNYDADMTVLRADDVAEALIRHAGNTRCTDMVMGTRGDRSNRDVISELQIRLPRVDFHIIPTGKQD